MTDIAIRVDHLSKMYRIGVAERQPEGLAGAARSLLNSPFAYLQRMLRPPTEQETLWALRDVSFEVQRGEVVGIIGRNGAGKSTLLKILSRITEPTGGRAEIHGRVGSLLEVGTGFHPELTGRENIYLNGAILGMKRAEIDRKFDEIVAFAEIERFLDTPVKRYSSGMYVRLAFAVAAHLEPEILLVDEVLAVGDAQFQKKCLGKMGEVAREGRTVLFVSHNMAAVQDLCTHGIVLKDGEVVFRGESSKAVDLYHRLIVSKLIVMGLEKRVERTGSGRLRFTDIVFLNCDNQPIHALTCGQLTRIRLHYSTRDLIRNVSVAIAFGSHVGENKIVVWTELLNTNYEAIEGAGYFECTIPRLPLFPGTYLLTLFSQSNSEILDWLREAQMVDVQEGDYYGIGRLVRSGQQSVLVEHWWS